MEMSTRESVELDHLGWTRLKDGLEIKYGEDYNKDESVSDRKCSVCCTVTTAVMFFGLLGALIVAVRSPDFLSRTNWFREWRRTFITVSVVGIIFCVSFFICGITMCMSAFGCYRDDCCTIDDNHGNEACRCEHQKQLKEPLFVIS